MRIKVKKLFNGKISLRDYEVREALKNKDNIEIQFNDDIMIIPYLQLSHGHLNEEVYQSKYGNKKYQLIDFVWNPIDKRQNSML